MTLSGDRLARATLFAGVVAIVLAPIELGVAERSARPAPASSSCASCHADVAREWASSLHRRSFSDPLFQAGYRIDHRAFCRDCHAPRSENADPVPGSIAYEDGIGCTECHRALRAHPSAQPELDWAERACADCHQFHFPRERAGFDPSAWMQRTADEHVASGRAESCVDCHMRERGHGFAVRREDIAGAIAIEGELVVRGASTELVVRISNTGAGHAVPTGDVLRALELSVWPLSSPTAIETATLTRRFGTSLRFDPSTGLSARLVEREDTRVPPRGVREERFVFPGRVVRAGYRLDYLRASAPNARAQGLDDATNRMVLREGTISSRR